MLNKILDHMNNDHSDVLPLYVKHFCKRDDVNSAKLINVTEEGMSLLINNDKENEGEKVFIEFTKKTPFDKIHYEMIKMAKIARKALGVEVPEHYGAENHTEEERNKIEINEFIRKFKSVVIGTVSKNGEPSASYAPFFIYQGNNYLFINETEIYFENLKNNPKADLLFIQDENEAMMPSMRQRITYKSTVEFLEKNKYYEEVLNEFQKQDFAIQMTRNVPIFHLVKVSFLSGRYVKGPRQAFDITEDKRVIEITLGEKKSESSHSGSN